MNEFSSYYLGIDVAGANNTWHTVLGNKGGKPFLLAPPSNTSMVNLLEQTHNLGHVHSVAIDAPLTTDILSETGMRKSEMALRNELKFSGDINWIMSQNSMMAVPIRGQLFAEQLRMLSGTVIETHPTVNLHRATGLNRKYKTKPVNPELLQELAMKWVEKIEMNISYDPSLISSDGALDSFICASVAWLYIHEFNKLQNLTIEYDQTSSGCKMKGFAPFFILK